MGSGSFSLHVGHDVGFSFEQLSCTTKTSAFEDNANETSVSPNQPASTCRAKIIERKIEDWRHDIEPAQPDARSVIRDITDTARENAERPFKKYYRPMIDGRPPLGAALEGVTWLERRIGRC